MGSIIFAVRDCTTMGIKLKATARNEQKLKKINVISQGIARVWDGAQWSADKRATRNPAAWALEIETSSCHPASRYDDSELDLESFVRGRLLLFLQTQRSLARCKFRLCKTCDLILFQSPKAARQTLQRDCPKQSRADCKTRKRWEEAYLQSANVY